MSSSNNNNTIFLPPSHTRLVTIAAHVDHGKTSLADCLIEHNGIISERLAGTLRYLDSDPEEQRRGITMRSSAIGLRHDYQAPPGKKAASESGPRVVHLVDSPGHTDFSYEVSSALTACDACLLVVDAVEGMGSRTYQVFREVLRQQLVPVLVLNKLDRLATDLHLTPTEAYLRLRTLLETVNAAASAMITSVKAQHDADATTNQENDTSDDANNDSNNNNNNNNNPQNPSSSQTPQTQQQGNHDERLWTFDPAKNNVIFCSALFGWGFTSTSLARSLFRSQHIANIKPLILKQHLFGDFKYKNGKLLKWTQTSNDLPLFAEYGLQPIFDIYEGVAAASAALGQGVQVAGGVGSNNAGATTAPETASSSSGGAASKKKIQGDTPGMDQVREALQLGATTASNTAVLATVDDVNAVLTRTGASTHDAVLRALLRRFRPLASTVLDVVCECCPSPLDASRSVRSKCLSLQTPPLSTTTANDFDRAAYETLQKAVHECDADSSAPTIAHVCKFFSADRAHIRDPKLSSDNNDNSSAHNNVLLGLVRVLSARLETNAAYHVLGPKYDTRSNSAPPQRCSARCYLLMGSSLVLVDHVPAGHLCAVLGLEDVQLKTLTLCSQLEGAMPLRTVETRVRPLVKVSVEAQNADDTSELDRGLLKLSLADAACEVTATARGERILACLGELHLQQSLLDLKQVYCGREIALRTSDPICDFGETTDWFPQELSLDYAAFWDDTTTSSSRPQPPRQATIPPFNEEEGLFGAHLGRARMLVSGRSAALTLRVVPLADCVDTALRRKTLDDNDEGECNEELLKLGKVLGWSGGSASGGTATAKEILDLLLDCLCTTGTNGTGLLESPSLRNGRAVFGVTSADGQVYNPQQLAESEGETGADEEKDGTQPASAEIPGKDKYDLLQNLIKEGENASLTREPDDAGGAALEIWKKMKGSAVAGFQMAIRSGPICEEPVRNVLVVLEGFEIALSAATNLSSGMVVSALRSGIRCSLLTRPARLMEGYLRLTLNSSLSGLGSLYSVLSKRRGKIEDDSMVDGTDLLQITALIPQAEAFGLAPELFAKTSGQVTAPEMVFSHWQRLDVDPFWIPTTEEEREDFGELQNAGDSSTGMDNTALKYIRQVRERKGLKVDSSRTVVAAEKQRTLKK